MQSTKLSTWQSAIWLVGLSLFFVCQLTQALPLQGSAVYSRLGNDVYLASVFSAHDNSQSWRSPGAQVVLRMDILTSQLSPRSFYRLWNEGLGINLSEAELNQWADSISRFISLLPADLVAGDQVLISNMSGRSEVSINGVLALVLDDGAFVNLLLSAWIGKFPQSRELRQGLISMSADQKAANAISLEQRHFDSGRDALMRQWWAPGLAWGAEQDNPVAETKPDVERPINLVVSAASSINPVLSSIAVSKQEAVVPASKTPVVRDMAPSSINGSLGADKKDSSLHAVKPADPVVPAVAPSQRNVAVPPASSVQYAPHAESMVDVIAEQRASVGYLRAVLRHANSKAEYPHRALKRRLQGVAMVGIRLDAQGQLLELEMVQSSGSELLDQAALRAARQAAPYPQPPQVLQDEELEFDIPFRFAVAE